MTEQQPERSPEQDTNTQRQHEEPYESQMGSTNMGAGLGGERARSTTDYGQGTDREGRQGGERAGRDLPESASQEQGEAPTQQGGPVASGASFEPDAASTPMPISGESDRWTTPGLGAATDDVNATTPIQDEPGRWTMPGVEGSSSSPIGVGSGGGGLSSELQERAPLGQEPNQASTTDRAGATGFADASDRRTSSGIGGLVDRGSGRGTGTTTSGAGGGTASGLSGAAQNPAEQRKTTPLSGNLDQDTVE